MIKVKERYPEWIVYYHDTDIEDLRMCKVIISLSFEPDMNILIPMMTDMNNLIKDVHENMNTGYEVRNDYEYEIGENGDIIIDGINFFDYNVYYTYVTAVDTELYLNKKGDVEIISEFCKKYQQNADETYKTYLK